MPRKRHSEFAAGLFVIITIALATGVVLWLGVADIFKPTAQRAYFFVPESFGDVNLKEGNPVRIAGKEIGSIVEIRLAPQRGGTLFVAEIRRDDVKVHLDGRAHVATGLVGEGSLVITSRGTKGEPLADEKHPVRVVGGLDRAMQDIASAAEVIKNELNATRDDAVLAKIHTIVDKLKSAAGDMAAAAAGIRPQFDINYDASALAKVHKSIDDINVVTADARGMTTDARPKVKRMMTAMANASEELEKYAKKDVAEILARLRETNTEIVKIAGDFREVSTQAKEIMLVNRERIDEMIDNMTVVSANLKATSKEIRRNPWRLIYKPKPDQIHSQNIYDAARAFSNGAEQLDQAVAKLTGLAKAHPAGISPDDPQLTKIRGQLEDAFGKFSEAEQALWKELVK